jgi:hypothetical protein
MPPDMYGNQSTPPTTPETEFEFEAIAGELISPVSMPSLSVAVDVAELISGGMDTKAIVELVGQLNDVLRPT